MILNYFWLVRRSQNQCIYIEIAGQQALLGVLRTAITGILFSNHFKPIKLAMIFKLSNFGIDHVFIY